MILIIETSGLMMMMKFDAALKNYSLDKNIL